MPFFQSDVINSFEIDLPFSESYNHLIIRVSVFNTKCFLSIFVIFDAI
jgi:hypothetical protein